MSSSVIVAATSRGADLPSEHARHWALDPTITFVNHGSFGATPIRVMEIQSGMRGRLEAEPVRFFQRDLEPMLDDARTVIASFVGCDAADLALVENATAGVNAVLRSLSLQADDELLVTNHAYNACRNALEYVAHRSGARVVVADVPFPPTGGDEVTAAVVGAVSDRTRIALLDHVASPTALVLPIAATVAALRERGVATLVDGAHAAGMVPVDLAAIGADYYSGNCHKWLCGPKGAGFLYVRPELQAGIVPPVVSHGLNSTRMDRSRFRLLFDWTGTGDPTPALCAPAAIGYLATILPNGWDGVRQRNHLLALRAAGVLAEALGAPPVAPDPMLGAMVTLPLIDHSSHTASQLQDALLFEHGIEVPVFDWPTPGRKVLRISAHLYNSIEDYEKLAAALVATGTA